MISTWCSVLVNVWYPHLCCVCPYGGFHKWRYPYKSSSSISRSDFPFFSPTSYWGTKNPFENPPKSSLVTYQKHPPFLLYSPQGTEKPPAGQLKLPQGACCAMLPQTWKSPNPVGNFLEGPLEKRVTQLGKGAAES